MANQLYCVPTAAELATQLRALRSNVALVRALLDEIERLTPDSSRQLAVSHQTVEELRRIGRHTLNAANALTAQRKTA